uniref:COesterase domain-containing protein n=2 Tax=Bursaphelenchus xylophilus TaxID=6326 RepID=A0A1I7RJF0_BURXY
MLMFAFTFRPIVSHLDFHHKHNVGKYVSPKTVVTLKNGKVQGYTSELNHRAIHVYKGIPYSEPPEEEYRFEKPTPKEEWDGYWDATEYGPKCPQWDSNSNSFNNGAEDCLSYNVFARAECLTNSCPVIVFLSTDAQAKERRIINQFLAREFVVVTFNFRSGILGFLNLGVSKDDAPLNVGFNDITLALETISSEIGKFGGDPSQITVISEQSNIVEYLMATGAKTFAKAITISTTPAQLNSQLNAEASRAVMRQLGCERPDLDSILSCLRAVDVADLVAAGVQGMSPEADADALPFVSLESMMKQWREVPLLFIQQVPSTLSTDISKLCQAYTPLFSFPVTVSECERHYKSAAALISDVSAAYAEKIMAMNKQNGIVVSFDNNDEDLSTVFLDFASQDADLNKIKSALVAQGGKPLELSNSAALWLQNSADRFVTKRHLLRIPNNPNRHRRYVARATDPKMEQFALYLCCGLVLFIVLVVCFLAAVFYRRNVSLQIAL